MLAHIAVQKGEGEFVKLSVVLLTWFLTPLIWRTGGVDFILSISIFWGGGIPKKKSSSVLIWLFSPHFHFILKMLENENNNNPPCPALILEYWKMFDILD